MQQFAISDHLLASTKCSTMVWISIIAMIMSKAQICLLLAVLLLSPAIQCNFAVEGVRLSLNGAAIASDGYVTADDIGKGDSALLCHTDQPGCCFNQKGHWYFPNGTRVESITNNEKAGHYTNVFFRNRGTGIVRLNRHGSPLERGRFYCVVPDAMNMDQKLYVNIGMFIALILYTLQVTCSCRLFILVNVNKVTISPPGPITATAGKTFTLECSADIAPSPLHQNVPSQWLEWFFGPTNASLPSGVTVSNETISDNSYTSTLLFSSLRGSHAGMYTCRLRGNKTLAAITMIAVNGNKIV